MAHHIIVDGNSIGYAAHYATKLTSGELQTQAVFGFIKTMRDLRTRFPKAQLLVLWDGRATWRYDLLPEYKSKRNDDPKKVAIKEAYVEQRPYITRAVSALGIRQMTALTHEADDMAGYFVDKLSKNPANQITLITGDEDWVQLVRPNVTWHDPRDDSKVIHVGNLLDKTGYATPYSFLEGKCLQGDSSDCIPGVGGIGEKGAPVFLAEFGSVRQFWQKCDSGEFKPRLKAHLRLCSAEGRATFGRNFRMMQLLRAPAPDPKQVVVPSSTFDEAAFGNLCEELAFTSILRNLEIFTKTFKETA